MATVSAGNYTIGGIDLYFEASIAHASLLATDGGWVGSAFRTSARNLGNIVSAEFNPDVTYVEHYISVNGARRKDAEQALTKNLSIPFVFDEVNNANLKKFFLASSLGNGKLAVMEEPLVYGSASMRVKTDIGQDIVYSIPKCTVRPDGAMGMNIEDWWTGPMVIDVYYYNTGQYASKPYGVLDTIPTS
jgi:hypothetical protein